MGPWVFRSNIIDHYYLISIYTTPHINKKMQKTRGCDMLGNDVVFTDMFAGKSGTKTKRNSRKPVKSRKSRSRSRSRCRSQSPGRNIGKRNKRRRSSSGSQSLGKAIKRRRRPSRSRSRSRNKSRSRSACRYETPEIVNRSRCRSTTSSSKSPARLQTQYRVAIPATNRCRIR